MKALIPIPVLLAPLWLFGCATPDATPAAGPRIFTGICAVRPIGQNEGGLVVLAAQCQEAK